MKASCKRASLSVPPPIWKPPLVTDEEHVVLDVAERLDADVRGREAGRLVRAVNVGVVVGKPDGVDRGVAQHHRVADRERMGLVVPPALARDQDVVRLQLQTAAST